MKATKTIAALLAIFGLFTTYYGYAQKNVVKNSGGTTSHYATQLKHDEFPLNGTFHWTFFLGPVKQVSTHTFTPTHIDYQMRGKIYSTDYRMQQLSYDDTIKKWIGKTSEGIFYAIFFKDISANKITLYKRKCKQGLAEAIALQRPADDTTADHGWNVYTREGVTESSDVLPFSGTFISQEIPRQILTLSDEQAQWQGKTYHKITHHLGERRWVGQVDGNYLVMFYEYTDGSPEISLSIQLVDDVKKAYDIKHQEQEFIRFQTQ